MIFTLFIACVLAALVTWGCTRVRPVRVFVISLPHHHERRRRMLLQAPRVRFVDAVDGRALPSRRGRLTRGQRACFMSHVKAWKKVARGRDGDFGIVLEDSASVRMPMAWGGIRRAVASCPADWDVLLLGGASGLYATAIRRDGARRLVDAYERHGMRDTPVDEWVRSSTGLRVYSVSRPLVRTTRGFHSETLLVT